MCVLRCSSGGARLVHVNLHARRVDHTDTSPSLLCFLSCSIMFIMPFMSFMNFMWPKPEPGAVMCGWNDMSAVKFGEAI